ncbi:MAG: GTP-sensing pleiotropic transcriptional regulator CodY [Selenomonadales bacterium]|nr:GTP-sensing pleiotropic transcriptional regulator CodY [Selenomonadales bacterium]
MEILEGTRKINKLLHKAEKMNYNEISAVLGNVMEANLYIMDRDGKVLGYALQDGFECDLMIDLVIKVGNFPERYVEWLMSVSETLPNTRLKGGMCTFERSKECLFRDKFTTVVPIYGAGERIGTLIVAKFNKEFETPDLILAEYGATVVGMELLRDRSEKKEEETRKKATVQVALATLSYSEMEAVVHILNELGGNEGLLVASKIADRVGITRSVIVNALRKFESAGVIESKSLGMKGTYIRVLNEWLMDELRKTKK